MSRVTWVFYGTFSVHESGSETNWSGIGAQLCIASRLLHAILSLPRMYARVVNLIVLQESSRPALNVYVFIRL